MREWMLFGIAGLSLGSNPAWAQESETARETLQDIVVTGSRAAPRAATETSAPVDVLSEQAITQKGFSDLSQTLEAFAPSFHNPRSATSFSARGPPGATHTGT